MKIIGLTGGIGSGKTTVTHFFSELGVPIYIADVEAKRILATSKVVRRKVIALLGEASFTDGMPNKKYIASQIFNNTTLLAKINAIIHPKVRSHFKRWVQKQKGIYVIKEAAILFENGSYVDCDATILVTAPKEIRIKRVVQRDQVTPAEVAQRMQHQWEDRDKMALATYVIQNKTFEETKEQVFQLHQQILNLS